MLQKTRAVVLNTIEYAEASLIVKAYTEQFGLQSFLVNGVRKNKSKHTPAIFQPLSLIEIVAFYKKPGGLHRASEVNAAPAFKNIPYDIIKTTMAFFLSEVIYKSIKEEEINPELFSFIDNSIQILDILDESVSRFHYCFLIQLTRYLGFYPHGKYSNQSPWFDLQEGVFQETRPNHPYFLEPALSKLFSELTALSLDEIKDFSITATDRKKILEGLITYYELHHTHGGKIKSHEVLMEILS
jgi:DNA repair protein RecO (recombination protein O)